MTTPQHAWRTSSHSGANGECVEIAPTADGGALIRDTKHRHAGHLTLTPAAWHTLLTAAKTGHLTPGNMCA